MFDVNPQVLIGIAVVIGILFFYFKSTGKKPLAPKKPAVVEAAASQRPLTPAEVEREELIARAVKRTGERFNAKYDAEMDAKLDALNAPVK